MKMYFVIFIGSGLGGCVRYGLGKWVQSYYHNSWGTLAANLAACFIMGIIIGIAEERRLIFAASRLFWTIGFCGGFSTFSSFSNETLIFLQRGQLTYVALYVSGSIIGCLLALSGGIYAATR